MTAVLFDLDGTLLDTLQDLCDAVNYALALHGMPPRTLHEVRRFVGNGAALLIRRACADTEGWESVLADFRGYYDAHCRIKTRPYDGILDALKAIQAKYPAAVVSNKPDSAVKILCRDYFGDIYALGDSPDRPRKPAPDMVLKAMADLHADRCIYIGDSEVDVQTAQNAGIPCLAVLWGFRDRDVLEKAGARYFCQDPRDLPQIIEQMIADGFPRACGARNDKESLASPVIARSEATWQSATPNEEYYG